jgi:hypothetical protein
MQVWTLSSHRLIGHRLHTCLFNPGCRTVSELKNLSPAPPDNGVSEERRRLLNLIVIGKITMPGLPVAKFIEICAIMPSTRQFGHKRGDWSRLNPVSWLPKTIFALRRANLPPNLGLNFLSAKT